MPAIMMEWVSTEDGYALGQSDGTSEYTIDIVGYSNNLADAHSLMDAIKTAVDRYQGSFTTTIGNTYEVVACEILDRYIEKVTGIDCIETNVSILLTTNNTAS